MEQSLDEIKIIQDTYMKFWSLYITWFTWFFGTNLVAIGWLIANEKTVHYLLLVAFCALIIVSDIGGIFITQIIRKYSVACRDRVQVLDAERVKNGMPPIAIDSILGEKLALATYVPIQAVLFSILLLWGYVGIFWPQISK